MQTCLSLDILFGWRKASKCKKLVRHVQCRLKLLRCKRCSIVKHLSSDIAQLLKNGRLDTAFARVEQLYKDQGLLAAYDLLDHFCEFIIIHFSYIRRHRVCTNEINEAISTLIFAAAWCGDLPELQVIRNLFRERYGRKFCTAAVELHPGNYVNNEMREKLCRTSISNELKVKLINEIAKDHCLSPGNLDHTSKLDTHLLQSNGDADCISKGVVCEEEARENGLQVIVSLTNHDPHVSSIESQGSNKPTTVNMEKFCDVSSQIQESIVCAEEVEEFRFNELQDGLGEEKSVFLFNFISDGARLLIFLRDGIHSSKNPESRIGRPTTDCRNSHSTSNYSCRFSTDLNYCFVHPCYLCTNCHKIVCRSPFSGQQRRAANYDKQKVLEHAEVPEHPDSFTSSIGSCLRGFSPYAAAETVSIPADSRTMTVSSCSVRGMAKERILQSDSSVKSSSASSCKHVHPKLPDYDELVANFTALRREHQQRNAAAMALATTESQLH